MIRRSHVYPGSVIDGRPQDRALSKRLLGWFVEPAPSEAERYEATLNERLCAATASRANRIALTSPKGGVGKTTCAFLLGDLLAAPAQLRVLAIDANRDYGTLASLVPEAARAELTLGDLLEGIEVVRAWTELRPYLSRLPTGLDVLAAPARAETMARMTPCLYGQVLEFVSRYYDVVLLDLGTGVVDPLARFALERADQTVLITTPDYVTAEKAARAAPDLLAVGDKAPSHTLADRVIVVVNRAPPQGDMREIKAAFRRAGVTRQVAIPDDQQLGLMLDSATYSLEALSRSVRTSIKDLGVTVAGRLV